jgi:tetrahydromethanopterin S-methyltransferase subunit G
MTRETIHALLAVGVAILAGIVVGLMLFLIWRLM